MDFDAIVRSRRMCRDFTEEPVAPEVLDAVLATAFRGPTAGNTNMLDLVVLTGADTHRYWDVTLPREARGDFRWPGLLRAPVLVLPVVNPVAYLDRYSEPDKAHTGLGASADEWQVPYWWVDGGAAVMAMLLAAERHGLGALLFGQMTHEPDVATALGIPDGRRSVGTVALGHPAVGARSVQASARRGRPDPSDCIHRNGW